MKFCEEIQLFEICGKVHVLAIIFINILCPLVFRQSSFININLFYRRVS